MKDHELEQILVTLGHERHAPTDELVAVTLRRLRGPRAIPWWFLASLASSWIATGTVLAILLSPSVSFEAKACTLSASLGICAMLVILVAATRHGLARFLARLEQVAI